jgi:hypothetical protein
LVDLNQFFAAKAGRREGAQRFFFETHIQFIFLNHEGAKARRGTKVFASKTLSRQEARMVSAVSGQRF